MITLQCPMCKEIVETTTIDNFTQGKLGCSCKTIQTNSWYNRYNDFIKICELRNVKCLDTEEEFKEKTKEKAYDAMIKLQCPKCKEIVETTNISSFTQGRLGCKCSNSKSEKLMSEYVDKHFSNNTFKKIRPDWLENITGYNLELDYYCEELKLAFEYIDEKIRQWQNKN